MAEPKKPDDATAQPESDPSPAERPAIPIAGLLGALILIVLLSLVVLSLRTLYFQPRPPPNACADPFAAVNGKQQARSGPQGAGIAQLAEQRKYGRGVMNPLKLQVGQQLKLAFGRAVGTRTLVVYLDRSTGASMPHPEVYLFTRVDAFRRTDDGAPLDSQFIRAYAKADGQTVGLTACFDRALGYIGGPGTYTGSVTIDDNRMVSPVTVPITITLQYQHPWILLWLLLLAAIPGSWVLWVLRTGRLTNSSAFELREMLSWLGKVGGLAAVVTGVVAALAVYSATYLKDPSWGTSVLQVLALYGAMFSAFLTSAGITQIGSLAHQNPTGGAGVVSP